MSYSNRDIQSESCPLLKRQSHSGSENYSSWSDMLSDDSILRLQVGSVPTGWNVCIRILHREFSRWCDGTFLALRGRVAVLHAQFFVRMPLCHRSLCRSRVFDAKQRAPSGGYKRSSALRWVTSSIFLFYLSRPEQLSYCSISKPYVHRFTHIVRDA